MSEKQYSLDESFTDPNGNLYYTGYTGIFYSQDDGDTWDRFYDIGLGTNWIMGLGMSKEGYFYAVSDGGGIYRTVKPVIE